MVRPKSGKVVVVRLMTVDEPPTQSPLAPSTLS
jgi:hypothetical protein